MPQPNSRLAFEELRSVNSNTFDGTYKNLGTPIANQIRIFKITNDSTVAITVSYDGGTTDHEYLPAGGFLLIDITSNKQWDYYLAMRIATQFSVKGSAGTGSVYLSTYYAE